MHAPVDQQTVVDGGWGASFTRLRCRRHDCVRLRQRQERHAVSRQRRQGARRTADTGSWQSNKEGRQEAPPKSTTVIDLAPLAAGPRQRGAESRHSQVTALEWALPWPADVKEVTSQRLLTVLVDRYPPPAPPATQYLGTGCSLPASAPSCAQALERSETALKTAAGVSVLTHTTGQHCTEAD